jgi:hypothetical protein
VDRSAANVSSCQLQYIIRATKWYNIRHFVNRCWFSGDILMLDWIQVSGISHKNMQFTWSVDRSAANMSCCQLQYIIRATKWYNIQQFLNCSWFSDDILMLAWVQVSRISHKNMQFSWSVDRSTANVSRYTHTHVSSKLWLSRFHSVINLSIIEG